MGVSSKVASDDEADAVSWRLHGTQGRFVLGAQWSTHRELAGQEQDVIDSLAHRMDETFAGTGITFTTQPPAEGPYSIVYIGGDGSALREHGDFLGLAEQVDVGNSNRADSAFVFSEWIMDGYNSQVLADVVVHEVGHLLGYAHVGDDLETDHIADVAHTLATHEFITEQAWHLYKSLYFGGVIQLELDFVPERDAFDEGVSSENAGENVYKHFCEGADGAELFDGLNDPEVGFPEYDPAITTFSDRFSAATGDYPQTTLNAYYYLGKALHVLQDVTVPAHVHNDWHEPDGATYGDDTYEDNVTPGIASNYHEYFRFDAANNGASWDFQDWVNGYWAMPASVTVLGSSSQALWQRSFDYHEPGVVRLDELFRETADYTDDYDSDDYDGDYHNGVSGDGFPLPRLTELDRSADPLVHSQWSGVVENDISRDLEPWEVSVFARDVGTWAVEQSAMLIRAFYAAVGKVAEPPSNMHSTRTGLTSIEVGWDAVDGADSYIVYRSTSPNSGFSSMGTFLDPYYHDTALDLDTTYYYRVYANNDVAGLGRGYSSVSATTNPPDIDGDNDVDPVDASLLSMEIATGGTNLAVYDFNDDGQIGLPDLHKWLDLAGEVNLGSGISYLPADADLSGVVDGEDFIIWNAYKFTGLGNGGGGGLWDSGDFNADGFVNDRDFIIWNNYKFQSSSAVALPASTLSRPEDLVLTTRAAPAFDTVVAASTDETTAKAQRAKAVDWALQSYRRVPLSKLLVISGGEDDKGEETRVEAAVDRIFA